MKSLGKWRMCLCSCFSFWREFCFMIHTSSTQWAFGPPDLVRDATGAEFCSSSAVTRCFCALNQAFLSCDHGAKLPGTFRIMGSFTSLTIRDCVSVGKCVHMMLFTSSFQKPLEFPKMDLTLGLLWPWLITQSARLLQLDFGKHVCSDVFTKNHLDTPILNPKMCSHSLSFCLFWVYVQAIISSLLLLPFFLHRYPIIV